MPASVFLYSKKYGEIQRFLSKFYNTSFDFYNAFKWSYSYENPVEIAEIVGTFFDNYDDFDIDFFVSLDKNFYIQIDEKNGNDFIKYLFERFPY